MRDGRLRLFQAIALIAMVLCVAIVALRLTDSWRSESLLWGNSKVAVYSQNDQIILQGDVHGARWRLMISSRIVARRISTYGVPALGGLSIERLNQPAFGLPANAFVGWIFFVQEWFLVSLLAVISIIASLISRRMLKDRPGFCPVCGYDLRASPERCPECGAAVSKAKNAV